MKDRLIQRATLGGIALVFASSMAAAENSLQRVQKAERLFDEGRALSAEGELVAACEKFEASFRFDPAAGALLNLASCLERRGLLASARSAYHDAVITARHAGRESWALSAEAHERALLPLIPTVSLVANSGPPVDEFEFLVDGVTMDRATRLGEKFYADPGEHLLEVRAVGYRTWAMTVTVSSTTETLVVTAPPLVRVLTASPFAPSSGASVRHGISYGVLSLGATALAGGAILGGLALSKNRQSEERCPEISCGDAYGVQLSREAHALGLASTVTLSSGVALALGGVALLTLPVWKGSHELTVQYGLSSVTLSGAF